MFRQVARVRAPILRMATAVPHAAALALVRATYGCTQLLDATTSSGSIRNAPERVSYTAALWSEPGYRDLFWANRPSRIQLVVLRSPERRSTHRLNAKLRTGINYKQRKHLRTQTKADARALVSCRPAVGNANYRKGSNMWRCTLQR